MASSARGGSWSALRGPSGRGAVLAVLVSTVSALPAFLPGAVAVRLRVEFGWTASELGLALSSFFLTASLMSIPAGRTVERVGALRGMTFGVCLTTGSLLWVASSQSYWAFVVALCLGGVGAAFVQPAANLFLLRTVARAVLGRAFALKQSAIPGATLVAGLAVPALVLTFGWRAPMLLGASLAAIMAIVLLTRRGGSGADRPGEDGASTSPKAAPAYGPPPRSGVRAEEPASISTTSSSDQTDRMPGLALALTALTGAVGGACATAMGTFLIDSSVEAGIPEGAAGTLLAVASICGVGARLFFGTLADRWPERDQLLTVAGLLIVGAVGYGLLATGMPPLIVLGALIAYVLAWGWPGLFHLVVVTRNPATPAAATGVVQVGIALGAGLGPLLFGLLADTFSYRGAWGAVALFSVVAGMAALGARRASR